METGQLKTYIKLIFTRERSIQRKDTRTWKLVTDKENKKTIIYDHSNLLIDLYSNLVSQEEKAEFTNILIDEAMLKADYSFSDLKTRFATNESESKELSSKPLCYYTFLQLGLKETASKMFQDICLHSPSILLLKLLYDILNDEYRYFSINELDSLCDDLQQFKDSETVIGSIASICIDLISEKGIELIKKDIKGVNIEINRDKELVIDKIDSLGLDKKYKDFLNQIDIYLNQNDPLITSGMISNFRSFWEQFLIDIARRIASKNIEEIPSETSSLIGNVRRYLKIKLQLSEADNSLIGRFVEILHAEGGHAFVSKHEYFRLTRNIGIELLLFVLLRAEPLI